MIDHVEDNLTFTMPLTLKAHHIANQFRQQQRNINKGKQVYLNTLAVQTVSLYLGWMGIETDIEKSDSWNPITQTLADTADLVIKGKGKLECRPVLPGEQTCQVPLEVFSDRIGYVAVQFNQELTEATLLGFTSSVTVPEFPLEKLQPLDDLLEYLESDEQDELAQTPVKLGQWLRGIFETGWQVTETVLAPSFRTTLAFSFRDSRRQKGARRGKLLNLGMEKAGKSLVLIVGFEAIEQDKFQVLVDIYPIKDQTYLPQNLLLMVLDETGKAVMQAETRNTNNNIQLDFKGNSGERFSIKVVLGDTSITEAFII